MNNDFKYILYCFLDKGMAIFVNRWDEQIESFDNYKLAIEYAKTNFHLIDIKLDGSNLEKCYLCDNKFPENKLTITVRILKGVETGYIDVCDDCY